jgi:hypothetical protein
MLWRFDRTETKAAHVLSRICALASAYRLEDKIDRGGRRSWDRQALFRDGHSARGRERRLRAKRMAAASAFPAPEPICEAPPSRNVVNAGLDLGAAVPEAR